MRTTNNIIGIVDYKAGNIASVVRALDFLGIANFVSGAPSGLSRASRIIFPGVGAAGEAMLNLRASGLDIWLKEAYENGIPILGICLGTQIIMEASEEDGGVAGIGIIPGLTRAFSKEMPQGDKSTGAKLKVPHMGWNGVLPYCGHHHTHPVFAEIKADDEFYFVHSYYPAPSAKDDILGITEYGIEFCSAIARDNLVAVQFHPEKSGKAGLKILDNFSRWLPTGEEQC